MESEIAILWSDQDMRCVLSWLGDRFRLRLIYDSGVAVEHLDEDERVLIATAERLRRELMADSHGIERESDTVTAGERL